MGEKVFVCRQVKPFFFTFSPNISPYTYVISKLNLQNSYFNGIYKVPFIPFTELCICLIPFNPIT